MMVEKSLQIPEPRAPHPDTLDDPLLTIESDDQSALICYCPRNWCGAIYDIQGRHWSIHCQLQIELFLEILEEVGILPTEGDIGESWMKRIREVALMFHGAAAANDSTPDNADSPFVP